MYAQFKRDLAGWAEVPLDEFRALAAGRDRAEWDAALRARVARLGGAAGHALARLYAGTRGAPAAAAALAGCRTAPEPLPREELAAHLTALLKNCAVGGWTAGDYADYIGYLESDAAPADVGNPKLRGDASGSGDGSVPTADTFADYFRDAGRAYRAYVRERLETAATQAAPSAPAVLIAKKRRRPRKRAVSKAPAAEASAAEAPVAPEAPAPEAPAPESADDLIARFHAQFV
jgi:hypothetical protein